jgi:hypothetical protein
MNRIVIAGLVLLLACSAYGGGNPDIRVYFDFDPPNYVHEVYPALYTDVQAYLCLDNVDEGVTTVSFRMDSPDEACPGVLLAPNWVDYFPSGMIPVDPWPNGIIVVSEECLTSDPLLVGCVTVFYLGGACCLEILDHVEYPRWVRDCSEPTDVDSYCVLAHGSIGGPVCPEGDCSSVPVETETWGRIKSLYR